MRVYRRLVWYVIVASSFGLNDAARGQPSSAQAAFNVAPGYSLEPIAIAPLTKWPVLVDWDSKGNLLVVESGGVAHPIIEHNQKALHRLVRLIDENSDGTIDRRELVAENLPFTEGILCLGSHILVSAPPVIYQLADPDGDGYFDQREVWFDGQTITGCANDLHGPYLGRDGWVYWCKGAFAEQKHDLLSGRTLTDKAAHIYRRKISGGPIEPVMSGGMDNPVGFAVLPNGERFFSSTFLVHPGNGLRDGVVHAIYGGTYGKDHPALDGVIRTGELMPVMVHLGPAAPSGMICLANGFEADQSQPTLVVTLFNHRKLIALPLQESGATYQSHPVELVVGNRIDFHPTDVLQDMDGSLIVVDTGGWYNLCCPSSRVDQELALGGIYRLKSPRMASTEESTVRLPRAIEFEADMAVELLDNSRPWVRRNALLQVASSDDRYLNLLKERISDPNHSLQSRRDALWALGATEHRSAMEFVRDLIEMFYLKTTVDQQSSLDAAEMEFLHIACHLVSLHRYQPANVNIERILIKFTQQAIKPTMPKFNFVTPALARIAAEALGRIGDADSVQVIFEAFAQVVDDRALDHSLRYAVYEIADAHAVNRFLENPNPKLRELALSTLDLLNADSYLTAEQLVNAARREETQATALRLLCKRPELSSATLRSLGSEWYNELQTKSPPALFKQLAIGWRDDEALQRWIGIALGKAVARNRDLGQPIDERQWEWINAVLGPHTSNSLPAHWYDWLTALLEQEPMRTAQALQAVRLESGSQLPLVNKILECIAANSDVTVRRSLLVSLPPEHLFEDLTLVKQEVDNLLERVNSPTLSGSLRDANWALLKRLKIDQQNAVRILDSLEQLPTGELMTAIEIVASVGSEELDRKLLGQLTNIRAARGLPAGSLVNLYRNRSESLRSLAQQITDTLNKSDPDVSKQVQSILEVLPQGDPVRGLELFHGAKANCGGCHQMGYLGGKIGPELSEIGRSRTREALLEAILFPSARIEQGFQATHVLTVDGRIINGIPSPRTNGQTLELRVSADRVESIQPDEIEQSRPSDISIMPGGMLELLSHQEIADLISLLEAAR